MATVNSDREWLEALARDLEENAGSIEEDATLAAERLREIARSVGVKRVETVEQTTAMKTTGAAPDGWSWDDLNRIFTGYYGGIRLQRGEPMLEQDGHVLMFRQGEVSFTDRQVSIYCRVSSLEGVTVVVVNGFKGDRQWWTSFNNGKQDAPLREMDTLKPYIVAWLKNAHAHPIEGWARKITREAQMPKLPL